MFLGEKISRIISVLGDSDNSGLRKKVANLAAQIQSVNQYLTQSISSIDSKLNSYISNAKKDMLDTIFPVGSMYTQYPGALSPKEIFEKAGYSGSAGSEMWERTRSPSNTNKSIWIRTTSSKRVIIMHHYDMQIYTDGIKTKKFIAQRIRNKKDVFGIFYNISIGNFIANIPYCTNGSAINIADVVKYKIVPVTRTFAIDHTDIKVIDITNSIVQQIQLSINNYTSNMHNVDVGHNAFARINDTESTHTFFIDAGTSDVSHMLWSYTPSFTDERIVNNDKHQASINIGISSSKLAYYTGVEHAITLPRFDNILANNMHHKYKRFIFYNTVRNRYLKDANSVINTLYTILYSNYPRNSGKYFYNEYIFEVRLGVIMPMIVICD